MSRSTRSTRSTATASTVGDGRRSAKRSITNYTFTYQRDRVSRRAGSSYLNIAPRGTGTTVTMTLQEARSLYNFLEAALGE